MRNFLGSKGIVISILEFVKGVGKANCNRPVEEISVDLISDHQNETGAVQHGTEDAIDGEARLAIGRVSSWIQERQEEEVVYPTISARAGGPRLPIGALLSEENISEMLTELDGFPRTASATRWERSYDRFAGYAIAGWHRIHRAARIDCT